MKIKFTNFVAATMAAMAVTSCSNNEELVNTSPDLVPGSTRVIFNVGSGAGVTRGALTDGSVINDIAVKLFKVADGSEITGITHTLNGNQLSVTVPADKFISGDEVAWRITANTQDLTQILSTHSTALEKEDNSTIQGNLPSENTVQSKGLPAFYKLQMPLQANTNTTQTAKLSRIPARLIVEKNGVVGSITGYNITINNLPSGAGLYSGSPLVDNSTESFSYAISMESPGVIGYFYPSAIPLSLVVTNNDGTSKTVNFQPTKNKSYKLKITPTTSTEDGEQSFDLSMEDWSGDEDLTVEFGETLKLKDNPTFPTTAFQRGSNGELVLNGLNASAQTGEISNTLTFTDIVDGYTLVGIASITRAIVGTDFQISSDGMLAIGDVSTGQLEIKAQPNFGEDQTYTANLMVEKDGEQKQMSLKIIRKGLNLPENFTTTINGIELMSVGMGASLDATIATINNINKESGTDFAEKAETYALKNTTNRNAVYGKYYLPAANPCPKGFHRPTLTEIQTLFDGGLPAKDKSKNLSEGNNTMGFSTLNFSTSKHGAMLTDGAGTRWYLPMIKYETSSDYVWNIVSNETNSSGKYYRAILWNKELQLQANTTATIVDNVFRCVKTAPETYTK